jgi:RNA polymerase subunit RPABC4/transcription elongation factor Spt4
MHWQCAACGELVDRDAESCPKCGAPIPLESEGPQCPNCDAPVPEGAKLCPFCGHSTTPVDLAKEKRVAKWVVVLLFVFVGLPAGLFGACSGVVAFTGYGARAEDVVLLSLLAIGGLTLCGWLVALLVRQLRS